MAYGKVVVAHDLSGHPVGPYITTVDGKKYILVIFDNFTKLTVLYAVRITVTEELLDKVREFVGKYGLPRKFITDRGICFILGAFLEILL